jgi:hypothetical protein
MKKHLGGNDLSGVLYKSLLELDDDELSADRKQRCRSALHIIDRMDSTTEIDGTVLFLSCTFTVEHKINAVSEFQTEIDRDRQRDIDNQELHMIEQSHLCMAVLIKKILPQIPTFRGYFALLGLIPCAIHYVLTMSQNGVLLKTVSGHRMSYVELFPTRFPPLPIRMILNANSSITLMAFLDELGLTGWKARIQTDVSSVIKGVNKKSINSI